MFDRMKTEYRHVCDAAGASPAICRTQWVRVIYDQREHMPIGQGDNRIEIRWVPGIVDGQNSTGVGSDALRDPIGIEVQRVGRNISKDRTRSLVEDAVRSRGKSQRRSNRLIARLQASRERRSVQGRGTGTESDGMLGAYPCGQSFFEFGDFRSSSQPIRAQHIRNSLNVVFGNGLAAVGKELVANGSSPVNGQHYFTCGCRAHVVYAFRFLARSFSGSNR